MTPTPHTKNLTGSPANSPLRCATTAGSGSGSVFRGHAHVSAQGTVEVARHLRSTPGTPRIDDAHYPPRPAGPLNRRPKAANAAEVEFLALGEGARLWLIEAAAAGTARIKVKMTEAVTLARLYGNQRVDWALGHAATFERFADGDLVSILAAHPVGAQRGAGETHSMQPSTRAWKHVGGGDPR